jgi:phosphoribosylglycinamide formyltransferase 1
VGKRLVVLLSGTGSNLTALLSRADLGGQIELVISDRAEAAGLERARQAGVATACVPFGAFADRASWELALRARLDAVTPDLVILAGFMRILSGELVRRWPLMNVHPSLLPAFPGAHAVADALAHGVKVTGSTVHFVDELVDHGPIIAQEPVCVRPSDTIEALHERIKAVEHRLLPHCVRLFCEDRLEVCGRHVRIRT